MAVEKLRKAYAKASHIFAAKNIGILEIQSTLVISKSKGPSKTLRDIRTSTYQIYSIEEKNIRTTTFHK